jgi:type II secretion system protein N
MIDTLLKPVRWLMKRKFLIVVSGISFLIFLFFLFPFTDLSDLITQQVAEKSQNQVFVTFDKVGLGVLPLGVKMESVVVDTSYFPPVKASTMSLSPSIASLLTMKPGFTAHATGLFGGGMDMTVKSGERLQDDITGHKVSLNLQKVRLQDLARFAQWPVDVSGSGSVDLVTDFDPTLTKQPSSEYNLSIQSLKIPAGSVPTPLGPLNLPTVDIAAVLAKGRWVNGELFIEESTIGKAGDFVNGRIKGKVGLRLVDSGQGLTPVPGAYELKVDLTLNRDAESQLGIFLSAFDKYRTLTGSGARYAMQLNGTPNGLPQASALGTF